MWMKQNKKKTKIYPITKENYKIVFKENLHLNY